MNSLEHDNPLRANPADLHCALLSTYEPFWGHVICIEQLLTHNETFGARNEFHWASLIIFEPNERFLAK